MSKRDRNRRSVICEIDREIGAAILRLGDYCEFATDRDLVISQSFCLLFVSLMLKDPVDSMDALDRILENVRIAEEFDKTLLYGEFLGTMKVFNERYRHFKFLLAELTELVPDDIRSVAEEVFTVEWSPAGDVLKIS